jgi:predicted molibdopterin-dependent oxidoreductase YjgC
MSEIAAALADGRVRVLLLFGVNMLSSYADAESVAAALDKLDLVVCHELFMNETTRRFADVVLPGTAWLEDVGCNDGGKVRKSAHTPRGVSPWRDQ